MHPPRKLPSCRLNTNRPHSACLFSYIGTFHRPCGGQSSSTQTSSCHEPQHLRAHPQGCSGKRELHQHAQETPCPLASWTTSSTRSWLVGAAQRGESWPPVWPWIALGAASKPAQPPRGRSQQAGAAPRRARLASRRSPKRAQPASQRSPQESAASRSSPPVLGLVDRQFLGWSPASSWAGRPPVLGLVARQILGWSPASSWAGRPPVLSLVARQFSQCTMESQHLRK